MVDNTIYVFFDKEANFNDQEDFIAFLESNTNSKDNTILDYYL